MSSPYQRGLQHALSRLGLRKKEKPAWQKALPAMVGLGGSAALYALLRKQRLSLNPVLRAIQKASKGKVTALEYSGGSHPKLPEWLERQIIKLTRGADDVKLHRMTPIARNQAFNQLEQQVLEHGTLPQFNPTRIEGAAHNYFDPYLGTQYRGSVNPSSNIRETLELLDKQHEAEVLHKVMPGIGPKSFGTAGDYLPVQGLTLSDLQNNLRTAHPEGYIIKPRRAGATGDVITHTDDLTALQGKRQAWAQALLKNPEHFVVQENIPFATERRIPYFSRKYHPGRAQLPVEYRLHTVGGQIVPEAMIRRYPTLGGLNPFRTAKEKRELVRQLQPQLDKLPEAYRQDMMMALDAIKTPEGKWRLIETNPGGRSGFLAPDVSHVPTLAPHHVYKAITGRTSKPLATVKSLAGGAAAAGTTAMALDKIQD